MMKRSDFLKQSGLAAASAFFLKQESRNKTKIDGKPVRPRALKPGDTIGLVAPAGIVYEEKEFERMEKILDGFGLKVKFGEHVRNRHVYFSGTDLQRAEDLNRMFADETVDGIMAVRGGWGCARILPYLDFDMISQNRKVYCGFSDNTTLHFALLHHTNLVSFHGPNGNSDWTDLTKSSFKEVIMEGKKAEFQSKSRVQQIIGGNAAGRLIGGNLTILTTSLGTPYQPDFEDAILFVEDIGEQVYKIDRMITHLKHAGVLEQISGFVFGRCTDCGSGNMPAFPMREMLQEHLEPFNIPAIMNADIGHEPDNFTIPQGVRAELDAGTGVIKLTESAVVG